MRVLIALVNRQLDAAGLAMRQASVLSSRLQYSAMTSRQ